MRVSQQRVATSTDCLETIQNSKSLCQLLPPPRTSQLLQNNNADRNYLDLLEWSSKYHINHFNLTVTRTATSQLSHQVIEVTTKNRVFKRISRVCQRCERRSENRTKNVLAPLRCLIQTDVHRLPTQSRPPKGAKDERPLQSSRLSDATTGYEPKRSHPYLHTQKHMD